MRPHSHTVRSSHTPQASASQPLIPGYTQHQQTQQQYQQHQQQVEGPKKSLCFAPSGRETSMSSVCYQKGEGHTTEVTRAQSVENDKGSRPQSAVVKSELSGELPFR